MAKKIRGIHKADIDLNEMMSISQDAIMSRLNCHNIGKILDFDPTTQTCSVQMMQLKQFGNSFYTPAPLTQVPLIIYGGGGGNITLPNPTGSICLLLFFDRNIDAFMRTGEQYTPDTTRMHDFSDCVALTTFSTLANPINEYDAEAISLIYTQTIEDILYNAVIKNYANNIYLNVTDNTSNATINLNVTNLNNVSNATIDLTANNSQIRIDNLITIQNNTQNLGNLIQALITTIKSITITNNAVSTVSQSALNTVATNFAALLQGINQ